MAQNNKAEAKYTKATPLTGGAHQPTQQPTDDDNVTEPIRIAVVDTVQLGILSVEHTSLFKTSRMQLFASIEHLAAEAAVFDPQVVMISISVASKVSKVLSLSLICFDSFAKSSPTSS